MCHFERVDCTLTESVSHHCTKREPSREWHASCSQPLLEVGQHHLSTQPSFQHSHSLQKVKHIGQSAAYSVLQYHSRVYLRSAAAAETVMLSA